MKSIEKSYLYAGLSVLLWSTVATSFKLGLSELDFIQLIFYASATSVIILFFILVIQKKTKLLMQQTVGQLINSMVLGALNPLLYYLVLFKAYSLLPAQLAQPLNMVWPIVLTLLSVPLLGQKIGKWSIAGLVISFAGVVLISSQGGLSGFQNTSLNGVLLALGSSVLWALYWVLNVRDKRDGIVKLFLNFFFGLIFLAVTVFFFTEFRIEPGTGLYAAIYIGIFEVGVTYVFWMKAMQLSTNNAKIGNLIFLTPFLSLIFIRFILKETLFITTFAGLACIIAGILVQRFDKKNQINT
ncbi:Permease of the drug/metabolite transporter (DMT) superfamily [Mariniphaga anaerophila]|uniref:Permease of the drug/metabolite transporter (DMT) superfamily n=1 Tax=Mariniphaga anaerophila TaxID=1484053 RepID=A0A1M5CL16_9BACT|nr:DMT family transporter [Mariniphaga anaerophila]SHF55408.1 Permease of the drug/metabolite transporter (DMT) superfamily [Mariniphaga anaerophila]